MRSPYPLLLLVLASVLACACAGPAAPPATTRAGTPAPTGTPPPSATPTPTPLPTTMPIAVQIVSPPVTPTPASPWPPEAEKLVAWLRALGTRYGWWTILIVPVVLVVLWFALTAKKAFGTSTEKAGTRLYGRLIDLPARLRPGPTAHERALLKDILDRCEDLEMGGFVREEVVTAPLESVYVPLFTQAGSAAGKAGPGGKATPGVAGGLLVREGAGEPVPLSALLPRQRCLILTGGAGSGKSTFLRYVALALARALLERRPALVRQRLGWEVNPLPLPILLPLGGFGIYLRELSDADKASPHPALLLGFMRQHFEHLKLPEGFFEDYLNRDGRCLVLLDGLDEVAHFQDRVLISDTVTLFARHYKDARVVVTCRPDSYRGGAQLGGAFQRADIQPLRWPEDIESFARRWNEAVLRAGARAARENVQGFLRRLGQQDQVRELADNPLLLTVMLIVHSNVGYLPERRADLYDNATELLLRWDTRWRRKEAAPPPWLDAIQPAAAKRIYLEELAYGWQQQGIVEARREEAVAALSPSFLTGQGEEKEREAAERAGVFVDWVMERSYLLRPLRTTVAFYRHAFQEYLAARRLAREPDWPRVALEALHDNWDWWQESVLLALDHLSVGDPERAASLLRGLLDAADDPPGAQQHLVLAGRALAEAAREHLWPLVEEVRARLREAILQPTPAFAIPGRVEAGRALAVLGEDRPGVCDPLPLLVEVPGGPFAMGSPPAEVARWKEWVRQGIEQGQERYQVEGITNERLIDIYDAWLEAEAGVHPIDVPSFYIARCPVTVTQYAPFVEGGGYDERAFWTEEGWAWRQGEEGPRADYEWNQLRPPDRRGEPMYWRDHRLNAPNQPVIGVTWHEAMAYCRWLEEQFRVSGCTLNVWRNGQLETLNPQPGTCFRLPTEAEWEKAARGGPPPAPSEWRSSPVHPTGEGAGARIWPWGNDWDAARANTDEERRGWMTVPVGLYPEGASPYGALDMAGNTWEWTSTRWGDNWRAPAYPAPYRAGDGREDPAGTTLRVVRGGSWGNDRALVRCGFRIGDYPGYGGDDDGFRVARGSHL